MADIQSNIDINIDTSDAISSIKNLQRQISVFHQSLRSSGSAVNAAISEDLTRNLINSVNATKKFSASLANVHSTTESFTTALEKNKLSMGQYFKYASGATGMFSKKFKAEFETINQVAESRVRTLQTQFIKLGRDANGVTKAIKIRPLALDMQNYATQTAIAQQKQQIFNQLIKQGSTNLLNFGKNTQWAGRQLMVGFTVPLTMLGSVAAKTFMEMEKQVIRLKRVYGDFGTTVADTDKMVSQIRMLGNEFTKYGVAVSKTMELAADAAAMGKTGADLVAQVREASRLAVLGGVEQSQALETTTSLTNAFGIAAEDLAGKINFLNAVENQSVTSIEDLTIAIPKAGPVVQQLGGNVEDLAFFLTAMKEGGINASEGANALKSGLASIINPSAKASEFMNGFGISIKGIVEANKGDVKGMIMGMADALNTLDPLNRARAIEQMFGKFQFARISTLFQNVTKEGTQAQTVLGLAKATSAELAILSERELKKVSDSPMYKFQKAIEDVKTSLVPLGEQFLKMITPVIEFVKGALENFNKLDGGIKNFIMGTIAVLGALAPAAIMAFGLVANGVANLIKGGNLLRNVFTSIGRGTGVLGTQTQYMSNEQLEAAAAASSLNQAHQTLTQQFTAETSALRRLISAYNDTVAAQQRLTAAGAVGRTTGGTSGATGRNGKKFATGGYISGPGTGTSDSIPAMLSDGEYVVKASAVEKVGTSFLDSINNGYANGGAVRKFSKGGPTRTVDVGGNSYLLPKDFSAEQVEALASSAKRLHSVDPDSAVLAMTMLEQTKGLNDKSLLPGFARHAITANGAYNGASVPETVNLIMPDTDNNKFISSLRGNPARSKSAFAELKLDMSREKDFEIARTISKKMYEHIVSGGDAEFYAEKVAEKTRENAKKGKAPANLESLARAITGYDPNNKNDHWGVDRGHRVESGILKIDPRMWTKDFTSFDPHVENGFLSKISETPLQMKVANAAIDKLLSRQSDSDMHDSLNSLKQKLANNASFTEKERIAFSRVVNELDTNRAAYTSGMSKQESEKLKNFFQTSKLLSVGYKAANLESPENQKYRVGDAETTSRRLKELKQAKVEEMEAVRTKAIAAKRMTPAQAIKRVFRFAKGVVSVPGPKGAGDVVPAMLSPGESVIPAGMSKKYSPLISGMINDTIPGYDGGLLPPPPPDPFGPSSYSFDVPEKQTLRSRARSARSAIGGAARSAIAQQKADMKSLAAEIRPVAGIIMKELAKPETWKRAGQTIWSGLKNGAKNTAEKIGDRRLDRLTESPQQKQDRKDQARAKSGRIAQGGMGLSMAVGMASALPGPLGQAASTAVGPISAATAAMSLIPGPWGAAAGVIAGAATAIFQVNEAFVASRAEAQKAAKAFSSGRDAMKQLGEAAGTVSSSEAMDRIRAERRVGFKVVTGKNTFGASYMDSQAGQELLKQASAAKLAKGGDQAASNIAIQLSQAVANKVLDKKQAASIAFNLGEAMNDYDFAVDVETTISKLIGPNGEDLSKDPITIQANIMEAKQDTVTSGGAASSKSLISTEENILGFGFTGRANYDEVKFAEVQYSQMFTDIADMGQQNLDTLELEHIKRLEILEAAGDLKKIDEENNSYNKDRAKILQNNATALREEYDYIDGLDKAGGLRRQSAEQIVDNIENSLEKMYEGADQVTKDMATRTITAISDSSLSKANKATLVATMTVENMDLFNKAVTLFDPDMNQINANLWNKVATITLELGKGSSEDVVALLPSFTDASNASKFIEYTVKLKTENADKADGAANAQAAIDTATALKKVEVNGEPIKLDQFIDTDTGEVTAAFLRIQDGVKKINTLFSKNKGKKISYEIVKKETGMDLTNMQSEMDYFNSLPAEMQKTYTTAFLTFKETIDLGTPEGKARVKALRSEKIASVKGNSTLENYWSQMSDADVVKNASAAYANSVTEDAGGKDYKPSVDPKDPKDTGGGGSNPLDDLLKRLKNIRAAAVDAAGRMKELMKWMTSGALEKKGGGLLFNGIDQQLSAKGLNKDFISFITDADKATQNQFITIKNGVVTLKKEGTALQNLFNALTIGDYERSVAAAVASSKQELAARKDLLETGMSYKDAVEAGKDSGLAEAIAAIKASTNIKDKNKAIAETIALYKQQKAAAESVKTNEDKFNELSDKVGKKIDAEKQKITLDFEISVAGEKAAVTKAQDEIDAARFKIDDLNAGMTTIGWAEEEINKKYDARKETLEKVKELNDKIAASQKDQLSLASALSSGDMAAAAKAAQDMRANASGRGLDDMGKELDLARQGELDGITATVNGKKMTRKEIEKQIKDLEKEIFVIEESRLEPAQEAIRKAETLRDTKLKTLDDEKIKWDQVKNSIDLANTAAINYADSLKAANGLATGAIADSKNTSTGPTTNYNDSGASGGATGAVAPTTKGTTFGQVSKDKKFIWNGLTWKPVNTNPNVQGLIAGPEKPGTKVGNLSSDKKWKWDGKTWVYKAAGYAMGGMVNYMSDGGSPFAPMGTDTVPAMLTPGEFVMSRGAVAKYGSGLMDSINNGQLKMPEYKTADDSGMTALSTASSNYSNVDNSSVYNSYTINVSGGNNANANDVARLVIDRIKGIDNQRIKGNRIS